jgi:hypothetical protein
MGTMDRRIIPCPTGAANARWGRLPASEANMRIIFH